MNHTICLPWKMSLFPAGMLSISLKPATVKSLDQIRSLFDSPPVRDAKFIKKELPCWSPALYEEGDKRANDNVKAVTSLVYDFDHVKEQPGEVAVELKKLGVAFVLHTTWSHRPSEPRYRVILFLSRPLEPKEYATAWENGIRLIGYDGGVDRQARNISRHYALPAHCRGEEYLSVMHLEGSPLDVDKVSKPVETKKKIPSSQLTRDTKIKFDDGEERSVADAIMIGAGKYKCACPFQVDAAEGSAFLRVTKDGRCFLQCTSERHTHDGSQFWLSNKKGGFSARSVEDRIDRLSEVPDSIMEYAEERIGYNALQGVFYRHADGAWQISMPMRKETLQDHLIGLMPKGCNKNHAAALIDHILSRQVYGFDCQPLKDRIVRRNEVSMLNLYAWPDLTPQTGPWPRIEQLLNLLVDGDSSGRSWLMNWSASVIQNPDRRSMVAVLVLSPQQGIGKSLYGRLLAEIIGKANSVVISNRALRDNFNSHYVTSLLVLADEVGIDRNASDIVAEIKASVTDDRIHCSAPYAARTTVTNRMTWWMTSNKRRPFLVETDDRRFSIFSPSKAPPQYRRMLRDCFDSKTSKFAPDFYEEIQAFADEMMAWKVDWDLISRPYSSTIKQELQSASMGSVDSFVCDLLREGPATLLGEYPPPPNYARVTDSIAARAVPCETLYGCYREWCQRKGRVDLRSETMVRLALRDMPGVTIKTARLLGRKMEVYVGIPSPKKEVQGTVVPMTGQ